MNYMYRGWSPVFPGLLLSLTILVPLSCSWAQSATVPATAVTAQDRSTLVESFATEKLWRWQKRLNLEDWKITVEVARSSELKPRTLGNIHWDTDKKTAVIHVLDPADYKLPFPDMLADVEFTVVHELIHLELAPVLAPMQRSDANRREEEHAVNHMTDALLQLDRNK